MTDSDQPEFGTSNFGARRGAVDKIDGETVDWMREPLTEREARVRKAYLDQFLDGDEASWSRLSTIGLSIEMSDPNANIASDLTFALALVQRRLDSRR
jgi:hypothetical protein